MQPKEFLCFQLQSDKKVATGEIIVSHFLLHHILCDITQQLIKNSHTREQKTKVKILRNKMQTVSFQQNFESKRQKKTIFSMIQ